MSAAAPHGFDEAKRAKVVHHFGQVVLGDVVRLRDVADRDQVVAVQGQVHQGAQRIVGVRSQSHRSGGARVWDNRHKFYRFSRLCRKKTTWIKKSCISGACI
jgi:hypothetical protein